MKRRDSGRETWHRLLEWDKSSGDAERLAAQVLPLEGYAAIDPSHPLGGADGKRDIVLSKNDKLWIAGVYFPRGQKSFKTVVNKFKADSRNIEKYKAEGFVFVTNQELKLSEREKLQENNSFKVDVYHLERMAWILNQPKAYGVRLDFLNIEMNKEEQLSALACRDEIIEKLLKKLDPSTNRTSKSNEEPIEVMPKSLNTEMYYNYFGVGVKLHFCSNCGFGYKVNNNGGLFYFGKEYSITCPKCDNTEYYNRFY